MAGTQYPKTYVLDRLDARVASLQRKSAEAEPILARYEEQTRESQEEYLLNKQRSAREALDIATRTLAEVVDQADPDDVYDIIKKHYPNEYGIPGTRRKAGSRFNGASDRVNDAAAIYRSAQAELDNLHHTRAYLEGTPVDSFTITSLKDLGLLDVIKFSLKDAKDADK